MSGAENALLGLARDHDARDLKQIGRRILDVVAPEVGECHEATVLAAEEARADAGVELVLVDDGAGRCHGRFEAPSHVGKMLKRHLLALANPARHTEDELKDRTPLTAGVNSTVVVTMTLAQLRADVGTAQLDDGARMSASQARRLACEAGVIPAVLDTDSQPLDLGRRVRLFTKAQRVALGLRDGGCTARRAHRPRQRPTPLPPTPPPRPRLPLREDRPLRQ